MVRADWGALDMSEAHKLVPCSSPPPSAEAKAALRKAEHDLHVVKAMEEELLKEYQQAVKEKGLKDAFKEYGRLLVGSEGAVIGAQALVDKLRQE